MTDMMQTAGGQAAVPDQPKPIAERGAAQRIASLDFIRGIAVLGILAANIVAFGQPFAAYMYPAAFLVPTGDPDGWQWVAQFVLVDGKMRGLFTLLFGAGIVLFMEKAWARGASRWLQVRRLFWLMIFGLIHFFMIWRGDILFLYSIAGMVALACVKWRAKTQLIIGLIGYLLGALLLLAMTGPLAFIADTSLGDRAEFAEMRAGLEASEAEALADAQSEAAVMTQGSYGDFVVANVTEHGPDLAVNVLLFALETLPLMLIGMALFRMGLFSAGLNSARQKRWGWIGVGAGSALTLAVALWAQAAGFGYWTTISAFTAFQTLPRLAVVLGLAALLALWAPVATGWLGKRLSAAGRAAFTNYLGTSMLMVLVFHPWAGGLWGELNRPQLYLVVLAAWVVMLAWSKPWLERFRYGPLEWAWRCLTYGRIFPLAR